MIFLLCIFNLYADFKNWEKIENISIYIDFEKRTEEHLNFYFSLLGNIENVDFKYFRNQKYILEKFVVLLFVSDNHYEETMNLKIPYPTFSGGANFENNSMIILKKKKEDMFGMEIDEYYEKLLAHEFFHMLCFQKGYNKYFRAKILSEGSACIFSNQWFSIIENDFDYKISLKHICSDNKLKYDYYRLGLEFIIDNYKPIQILSLIDKCEISKDVENEFQSFVSERLSKIRENKEYKKDYFKEKMLIFLNNCKVM